MKSEKKTAQPACPVARTVNVIGDRWSLLIIRDAFDGVTRFGDFHTSLGIARNILTDRLKSLEAIGVLTTVAAADGSMYRDYVLTETGRALFPVVLALRQWGEDQLFGPKEKHSMLVERASGKPVPKLTVVGTNGQLLESEDTVVKKLMAS